MNVILIAGEPGTGKSSLVKTLIPEGSPQVRFKTFRGYQVGTSVIAGIYEVGEKYPGTDKLSMAVQPHFLEFVDQVRRSGLVKTVLAEGDRISNGSLLIELSNRGIKPKVFVLKVAQDNLNLRRKARGDNFSEVWLRGRTSKVKNFAAEAERLG